MATASRAPLVAIVGATGTGKSDLAVALALKHNGEIINGDAMQLYEGLPIITNKITKDEMRGVPHHLLGCISHEEQPWTVGTFVAKAMQSIDEIRSRGKLPILVGGTHYYTQSLLFKDALAEELADPAGVGDDTFTLYPILDEPTEVIIAKLREVDPIMADRWHPSERRKLRRSLEIYLKTGKPASQIYNMQRLERERTDNKSENLRAESALRFPTVVFWVHTSIETLRSRLNARVDKMIDNGLLKEVEALSALAAAKEGRTGLALDRSKGIWVSIGYKEFAAYQAALSDSTSVAANVEALRKAAIEQTQAATRQYAKRQTNWIRIKMLNAFIRAGKHKDVFLVDSSDLSSWETAVVLPAEDVVAKFLKNEQLPDHKELAIAAEEMLTPKREYDLARRPDLWERRTCDTCGIVAVTENEWRLHIKGRAHRRAVGARKKQEVKPKSMVIPSETSQNDLIDIFESSMDPSKQDKSP